MRYWVCIAVWCFTTYGFAQISSGCKLVLSGIVLDEHDDASLGYATIYIPELDRGVVTDSMGRFAIDAMCAGTYTLQYSHIGCESRQEVIRLRESMDVTLHLEHHSELLETIELHARRIREAGTAASTVLSRENIIASHGQSLGQILQQMPGVNALQTGPAIFKPVIHGLHSNRVLIVRNNLRLESQQWGQEHAPEIDPSQAAGIRVIKGAAAVEYGTDAVAGVVVIEPEKFPASGTDTGYVALSFGSNGRSGVLSASYATSNNKGWSFSSSANGRRAGDAHAARYQLTNTGFAEGSGGLSVGYTKGLKKLQFDYQYLRASSGILRSAHIGNLTDLELALERDTPLIVEAFSYVINNPKQEVQHHTALLSAQTYVKNRGLLQLHYAYQWNIREEFDLRRGMRDDIPALHLNLNTQTATVSFAHQPVLNLHGKWTVQNVIQVNENVPGTGVRPLIPNYTKYSPAVSLIEKWIAQRTEVELGARYEPVFLKVKRFNAQNQLTTPSLEFHSVAVATGVRHEFTHALSVATHLGMTQRAPSINELFSEGLHHGAAAIEDGDTALVPETAFQWITDIEVRKQKWQAQLSFYVQRIEDFIYLLPTGEPRLTIRGAFPVFQYVQSDVTIKGVDLSFQIQLTNDLSWRSDGSVLRARDRSENDYLTGMPSDRMKHGIEWKQQEYHAGISWEYVSKQTRVPESGDYTLPPAAYHLLHASAGLSLMQQRLQLRLTVRNLLNTSYREYLNRLRYYADDTGRNIEMRLHYTFL